MRKRLRPILTVITVIMIVVCAMLGLSACNFDGIVSKNLNLLADQLALIMLGNDAYSWNVFSVDPLGSYGYEKEGTDSWYAYNGLISDEDITDIFRAFSMLYAQFNQLNATKLHGKDIATYNTMKYTLETYIAYYGSPYAKEFSLMGGVYVSAQGGYVADFTSAVENYSFRNKSDVETLLAIAYSTEDAFKTYIEFARDRKICGHPLYDYTINEMQSYLNDIIEKGDEYYLYSFINKKIDGAEFLSETEKNTYKNAYKQAIDNSFMEGVKALNDGLDEFKGEVTETQKSYLATYGYAGSAYYQWSFENKTGIRDLNMESVFDELSNVYQEYAERLAEIEAYVETIKETNPNFYNEFNAYLSGEKKLLDLQTPEEMLAYLKVVAKQIVPDLATEPEIDFKYMDETVAKRSNTLAYYLRSPLDDTDSTEHITLNPYYIENSPSEPLLTTICHEGYPGHLYASVKAKESGVSLLTGVNTVGAFVEGWAVYTQLELLNIISKSTESEVLKLYCEYLYCDTVAGYIMPILMDININYYGATVEQLVEQLGMEEDRARSLIETLMELPAVYVSYGYGAYAMIELHDMAKTALGDKYNEVEFNGLLLSEGMGPTLTRASQITENYIASKKLR